MAGSAVIGALRVNLGIDTAAFNKGLSGARRTLADAGKKMQSIGTSMSIGLTAPLAAFGTSIVRTAGDFEAAMNKVGAVTSAPAEGMKRLQAQAKELGRTTQFSASQAADAMGFLGMAGFNVEQIVGALPGTLQLAAAAQMDLASSADIVSNVLSGYGMKVEQLSRVNDVLVKTFTRTNTDLRQLGEAMKYAGPVASAAGVRFEEAAAAIGLMGNAGIQASMAGTSLRGAISRVLSPTKAMSKAMDKAGLKFTDAQGRLIGLDDIVRQLEPHADNAGLMMELFGLRAGPAMAALVSQGADSLTGLTTELENAGGTAERIATAQMQGFNGEMKKLASAFEGLKLAIADSGLLEWVTRAVQGLADFISKLSETSPALLKWGTIVAGVAAALGPVVLAIGGVALALSAISLPVAAGIAGVVALGGAFVAFGDKITGALGAAWSAIRNALGPPLTQLAEAAKSVLQGVSDVVSAMFGADADVMFWSAAEALKEFFGAAVEFGTSQILANLSAGLQLVSGALRGWGEIFRAVADLIRGDFGAALAHLGEVARNAKDTLVQAFNTMVEPVRQAVANIVATIIDGFSGLPAQMVEIGRNIGQGLINGINELTGPGGLLENTVFGVARRMKDRIESALGIQSPSRVMHEIGVYTMEGLRNGLQAGQAGAVAVAQQTAEKVSQAIALVDKGGDAWGKFKTSTAEATDGLRQMDSVGQSLGTTIGSAISGLINGTKSFKEIVADLLGKLSEMFLSAGFQALQGAFGGGTGGGFFSGLLSGLGGLFKGLPGFAQGGTFTVPGGSNSTDSKLAAMRVSPGETVSISRSGERDRGGPVGINVNVDGANGDSHVIELVKKGVRAGIQKYDEQMQGSPLLDRISDAQLRFG